MLTKHLSSRYRVRISVLLILLTGIISSLISPLSPTVQAVRFLPVKSFGSMTARRGTVPAPELASNLKKEVQANFSKLPLRFEANRGQTSPQVKFFARGQGFDLYLTARDAVFSFHKSINPSSSHRELVKGKASKWAKTQTDQATVLRMKLNGANSHPLMTGMNQLVGKSNYFRGKDPKKWRTDIPSYQSVKYSAVYPGIDLTYYEHEQQLEYDFIISPGADPNVINLGFEGATKVHIDARGDLVIKSGRNEIRHRKPVAYQEVNGARQVITSDYVLTNKNQIKFRIGAYDRSKPLVIDPAIAYSTLLGSSTNGASFGIGIALQTDPNTGIVYTYIVGTSRSSDFPTRSGLQFPATSGLFVAKFNTAASGDDSLVYSTYIQGTVYDGFEKAIAVDASGSAYVVGRSDSTDFPTINAFQPVNRSGSLPYKADACIAKLAPDGSALLYSSYLGGWDSESANGVAVDSAGNAYIVGTTGSADLPIVNAYQPTHQGPAFFHGNRGNDVFIAKIAPPSGGSSASLAFSTYLGGAGEDTASGIAIDPAGNVYVTGTTNSPNFPILNGFQTTKSNSAAFLVKLNPSVSGASSLIYSTYLSGENSSVNYVSGIALDSASNAYLAGFTGASNFPVTPGAFRTLPWGTGFVTKIDPSKTGAASLIYSTYVGDYSAGIAVDSDGNAYITGTATLFDLRTVNALQTSKNGIFQSVDNGASWTVTNKGLTSFNITDIVIDTNTVPRTLYASSDPTRFTSGGIFKSTDGGANWTAIHVGLTNKSVRSLNKSPNDPSTLYASTSNGFFKSTNGGSTWSALNDGIADPSIHDFSWHNLVFDTRTTPATLYTWTYSGFYKMSDGGNTWTSLGATLPDVFNLVIDTKTNPASLYAMTREGLYRSRDGGSSWNLFTGNGLNRSLKPVTLAIDPSTTPSTLYVYDPDIDETNAGLVLVTKSTDDGFTWQDVAQLGTDGSFCSVRDLLVLDRTAQGTTLYLSVNGCSYGMIMTSTDNGTTWDRLINRDGRVGAIALDTGSATTNTPSTLYVGTATDDDSDAYVAKLNPTGSDLLFSTYLGGIGSDYGSGVAVDSSGNIYVVGGTKAANFPTLNAYEAPTSRVIPDSAFVTKLGSVSLPPSSAGNVTTRVGLGSATLTLAFPNITGSTTTAPPTISANPIDSQTAANLTLSNNVGAYEIKTTATYDTSGYATDPTKGIKLVFTVPTINEPNVFNNLVMTHGEDSNGDNIIQPGEMVPYNGTVDPAKITYHDFTTRTVWVYVPSLSPFVIIKGAADQFGDLVRLIKGFNLKAGIENSLDAKLQNALKAHQAAVAKDKATACGYLTAFNNEAMAQTGNSLTQGQSSQLVAASTQLRLVLGCR